MLPQNITLKNLRYFTYSITITGNTSMLVNEAATLVLTNIMEI